MAKRRLSPRHMDTCPCCGHKFTAGLGNYCPWCSHGPASWKLINSVLDLAETVDMKYNPRNGIN